MNVQIVSIMAALRGDYPGIVWIGDIDPAELFALMHREPESAEGAVNEALFRFFNRVDEGDNDRLAEIGYELPSLSVGDLLHWGGRTFRVAGMGFDQITGSDEYAVALARYSVRPPGGDGL